MQIKIVFLALLFSYSANAFARVDKAQQQNALCYVKVYAPDLVFGKLPFSCNKKPEQFVEHVKFQAQHLSEMELIPNFKSCLEHLFETKNMLNVARGVWDLRDSPILPTGAATAAAISNACKMIDGQSQEDKNSPEQPQE